MKKTYAFFFFVPLLMLTQLHGQGNIEVFGLRTWATPQTQFSDKGWGGGINILCPHVSLTGKDNVHPIVFQGGAGFYLSGFGMKRFYHVPLIDQSQGDAKVHMLNMHNGVYALARFSSPNKNNGRVPYIDFMAGGRFMNSSMTVIPYKVPIGTSGQTDSTLYKVPSFMFGAGAGLQIKLSDNTNLDFELIWTYAPRTGDLVDMHSVQKNASGINFEPERSPNSILLLKVGFNFYCESSCDNCNHNCHSHSSYHGTSHNSGNYGGGHSSVHVSSGGGGHVMAK